jgi:foldase protein PrsA
VTACGGTPENAVVVRIGDLAITKATVDHWTAVIERKGAFSGFRGEPEGGAKNRALALLISSNWLIGEAAIQGVSVPESAIDEALGEREREGLRKNLRATGQSLADVKLEMRAELAAEAIREKLASRASGFSQQEVVDFYRANRASFSKPEERITDLIENLPSAAAAAKLVRRIGTGRRFAELAYHERVSRTARFLTTPEKVLVVNAIFAARPGVVSRPMMLNHRWTVFVVRKALPAVPLPLSKVRAQVQTRFNVTRQREIASRFDREYTTRWRAKTTCKAGFVGPGCPQAVGQLGAYEDPFSLRAHPLLSEAAATG